MGFARAAGKLFGKANRAVVDATTPKKWRKQPVAEKPVEPEKPADTDFSDAPNVANLRVRKGRNTYDLLVNDNEIHVAYKSVDGQTKWRKAADVGSFTAIDPGRMPNEKHQNREWATTFGESGGTYSGLNAKTKFLRGLGYDVQALDKRPAKAWRSKDYAASQKFVDDELENGRLKGRPEYYGPYIDPNQAHSTSDYEFRSGFFRTIRPKSDQKRQGKVFSEGGWRKPPKPPKDNTGGAANPGGGPLDPVNATGPTVATTPVQNPRQKVYVHDDPADAWDSRFDYEDIPHPSPQASKVSPYKPQVNISAKTRPQGNIGLKQGPWSNANSRWSKKNKTQSQAQADQEHESPVEPEIQSSPQASAIVKRILEDQSHDQSEPDDGVSLSDKERDMALLIQRILGTKSDEDVKNVKSEIEQQKTIKNTTANYGRGKPGVERTPENVAAAQNIDISEFDDLDSLTPEQQRKASDVIRTRAMGHSNASISASGQDIPKVTDDVSVYRNVKRRGDDATEGDTRIEGFESLAAGLEDEAQNETDPQKSKQLLDLAETFRRQGANLARQKDLKAKGETGDAKELSLRILNDYDPSGISDASGGKLYEQHVKTGATPEDIQSLNVATGQFAKKPGDVKGGRTFTAYDKFKDPDASMHGRLKQLAPTPEDDLASKQEVADEQEFAAAKYAMPDVSVAKEGEDPVQSHFQHQVASRLAGLTGYFNAVDLLGSNIRPARPGQVLASGVDVGVHGSEGDRKIIAGEDATFETPGPYTDRTAETHLRNATEYPGKKAKETYDAWTRTMSGTPHPGLADIDRSLPMEQQLEQAGLLANDVLHQIISEHAGNLGNPNQPITGDFNVFSPTLRKEHGRHLGYEQDDGEQLDYSSIAAGILSEANKSGMSSAIDTLLRDDPSGSYIQGIRDIYSKDKLARDADFYENLIREAPDNVTHQRMAAPTYNALRDADIEVPPNLARAFDYSRLLKPDDSLESQAGVPPDAIDDLVRKYTEDPDLADEITAQANATSNARASSGIRRSSRPPQPEQPPVTQEPSAPQSPQDVFTLHQGTGRGEDRHRQGVLFNEGSQLENAVGKDRSERRNRSQNDDQSNFLNQSQAAAETAVDTAPERTASDIANDVLVVDDTQVRPKRKAPRADLSLSPMLQAVWDIGGIRSRGTGASRAGGEYDSFERIKKTGRWGTIVINNQTGVAPDQMHQMLIDRGLLPENSTVDYMADAIDHEIRNYKNPSKIEQEYKKSYEKHQRLQQEEYEQEEPQRIERFDEEVVNVENPTKEHEAINASDLNYRDTFEGKDGEKISVNSIDQTTGEVTLSDGDRYGYRTLQPGQKLYVKKWRKSNFIPSDDVAF